MFGQFTTGRIYRPNKRHVRCRHLKHHVVSTVKLLGYGRDLWETMVFPTTGKAITDWGELACERYNTREAAVAGHRRMCARWKRMERTNTAPKPYRWGEDAEQDEEFVEIIQEAIANNNAMFEGDDDGLPPILDDAPTSW